uniref:Phosphofurin acidic cluster sorting protein 2 n=1 Tax=Elaeophora elaphi TaxID=1147741 RepID=A0A0R3RY56_9BILA
MDIITSRTVPMRLFANWETDRTIACAVQRMFSMALTRLVFNAFLGNQSTVVITVKLHGSKRSLRSNDFLIQSRNGRVDIDLNISFTIQYPHFLKRKRNILHILLQRRKRYKNRPILGYKTLAVGTINLSEVLQNCSVREIALFDPDVEKDDIQNMNPVGRLVVGSCQSQAFEAQNEVSVRRIKGKGLESEDEDDSSSDGQETNDEQELQDSSHSMPKQRYKSRKTQERKIARKNLKQKFSSLLKRFKIPEEETADSASRTGSIAPTAQELEELFEELDNLSDSGPEMVMDNMSIVSNPRPSLRPYFASREMLPSISDDKDNTEETDSDEEVSTDVDNLVVASTGLFGPTEKNHQKLAATSEALPSSTTLSSIPGLHFAASNVPASVSAVSLPLCSPNSDPTGNVAKFQWYPLRTTSVTDWLSAVIHEEESWNVSERLWLCDNSDIQIPSFFGSVFRVLDCSSFNDCRLLISSVVAKIQKFCNSSSISPPCTVLGVIGSEKLVNFVLRAYVESLQDKSAEWINFLRFCVVTLPSSPLGKMLQVGSGGPCALSELFVKSPDEFVLSELKVFSEKLQNMPEGACRKLPIGEAMLQLHSKALADEKESSQFVPFLSEVRVGQFEEDMESYLMSVRLNEEVQGALGVQQLSPPLTPHNIKISDSQDLLIEYWIPNNQNNESGASSGISSSATGTVKREPQFLKCSIRSAFRSFAVFRKPFSALLSFQFVKERRRDKMLQKIGMKKVQRNESESQSSVQCISNVARLICSGKHPLTVSIDGCVWSEIRFFQISAQWQTHVKYFPVCLLSRDI